MAMLWKNKNGDETDFIIKQGTTVQKIIQVTTDLTRDDTLKRETDILVSCAKEFDLNEGLILTESMEKTLIVDGVKIHFKPCVTWLLKDKV